MSLSLLGFAATAAKAVHNLQARELSPTIGWLTLATAVAFAALCIVNGPRLRKLWLRAEDPRTLGLFRILFGVFVLINVNGAWDQFEFLFTDEGLFLTETARQVLASSQFAGFGDGFGSDPAGFFGLGAVWAWLQGPKYSLLMFWSSPQVFWVHLIVFEAVTVLFILGWRSRLTGVLSFILLNSLMVRNPIYWTGSDVVYRVMFFCLILGRTGHAYSIDNWLRCRRLRSAGRLSEPGTPGQGAGAPPSEAHPHGLQAIYRRIPAWPRLLMLLQLATIYFYTGCAKTGSVWWRGDSLYYALNLDHFYRVPPQFLASVFGTNVFRLMTWVVHFWQLGFPLLLVGLFARFWYREKIRLVGWRRPANAALWTLMGLGGLAITWVAMPVHYAQIPGGPALRTVQIATAAGWLSGMATIGWLWSRLANRPFVVTIRGTKYTLDLDWACSWFLGRRLWLTIGVFFHMQILVLMNIGMFAPIMMLTYLAFFNGTEVATAVRLVGNRLRRARLPWLPTGLVRGAPIVPPEDPKLLTGRRDAVHVPAWAWWAALAAGVGTALAMTQQADVAKYLAAAGGGVVFVALAWSVRTTPATGATSSCCPPAYGPWGRLLATALIVTHITAVAVWCIPAKDSTYAFRKSARQVVAPWLETTQTTQSWNMFAPNPTRTNFFMHILVTDEHGETWDMRADANSPRNKSVPWIWYSRAGKISRRILGDGAWYQKWMGRYQCRRWAMDHGGESPKQVEIVKEWYTIPAPDQVRKLGHYRPEHLLAKKGRRRVVHTTRCATEIDGQLPNEIRQRHGLPLIDENTVRRWHKRRKAKWDRRRASTP